MSADQATLAFYDAEAAAYASRTRKASQLADFIAGLREGACVLDLGCGGAPIPPPCGRLASR